jgi:hypothetical protein
MQTVYVGLLKIADFRDSNVCAGPTPTPAPPPRDLSEAVGGLLNTQK